jgi:hypothetical protein
VAVAVASVPAKAVRTASSPRAAAFSIYEGVSVLLSFVVGKLGTAIVPCCVDRSPVSVKQFNQ